MSVLGVIAKNLLGFDMVILLAAAVNGFVCRAARKEARRLYDTMHQSRYVPSWRADPRGMEQSLRAVDEETVIAMRDRSERLYSVFINLTAIFPLLGILGTVVSLLPMVANLADMQQNFFAALTSTFWGLVFAIVFKLLDGFLLSAVIEDNDRSVALFLARVPEPESEREAAVR
jgi:Flagellar motor component